VNPTYRYRPAVLEALLQHGLRPTDRTPPSRVRGLLNDIYRFELRRLRSRLLAGGIVKRDYAAHVVALRRRYPLLSLPDRLWVE
jgi:hypothetical protein